MKEKKITVVLRGTGNSRAQCEKQSSGRNRTTTDSSNGSLDSGTLFFLTKIRSVRQQFENTKSEPGKPTATRASCGQKKEFEKKTSGLPNLISN